MDILIDELLTIYQNELIGVGDVLPHPVFQYKDYSAWQNDLLVGAESNLHRGFWLSLFKDKTIKVDFPADFTRPAIKSFKGKNLNFTLDRETTSRLNAYSRLNNSTQFMTLLSCVKAIIYRYTGQHEIVVGTPVSGRNHVDLEGLIGFFVNTVPVLTHIEGDETFDTLVENVKNNCLMAFEHQSYPFDKLVEDLELHRDLSRNPLCDIMVAYQKTELGVMKYRHANSLSFESYQIDTSKSKFDLTFSFEEDDDGINVNLEFNTDLFTSERMQRLSEHFSNLVSAVTLNSKIPVSEIAYTTESERNQLFIWGNNYVLQPDDRSILDCIDQITMANPDVTAIAYEDRALTYRHLSILSDNLASFLLHETKVSKGSCVALLTRKSEYLMIAQLAILKVGAAFVPLAIDHPKARLQFLLEDTGARVILTDNLFNQIGTVFEKDLQIVHLNLETFDYSQSYGDNSVRVCSTDLAYIIYTSGSLGVPKGVMIDHGCVVQLVKDSNYAHFEIGDHILQFSNYAFDGSIIEIYGALTNGATLCVPNEISSLSYAEVIEYFKELDINKAFLTTAFFNAMTEVNSSFAASFDQLMFGGESVSNKHVYSALKACKSGAKLTHVYGPTEVTALSTYYDVIEEEKDGHNVPIGRPLSHTSILILDQNRCLVPIGVPGEMYISGTRLSRGYLNQPELTSQTFIKNHYQPDTVLYRTGDLAKWLGNGAIEYIGRNDSQIKLRGFRIELNEVESVLRKHDSIQNAVAMVEKGELIIYYTGQKLDNSTLKTFTADTLPTYMVPSTYNWIQQMPINANGKVNRSELAKCKTTFLESHTNQPPQDEVEELILKCWHDVLGDKNIGVDDNFFEIGGDSIKAIQISSRLFELGYRMDIKSIFLNPTVRTLASVITKTEENIPKNQGKVEGGVPLTPIQHYFFRTHTLDTHHFNQAVILQSSRNLTREIVTDIFNQLQDHHDALRITFNTENGEIIQWNHSTRLPLDVLDFDFSDSEDARQLMEYHSSELQKTIDLKNGPLFKLAIFHLKEDDHLLIIIHHLIIDTVSWRIVLEDYNFLLDAALSGKDGKLSYKGTSYKCWSEKLLSFSQRDSVIAESRMWDEIEQEPVEIIPADNYLQDNLQDQRGQVSILLDTNLTHDLITEGSKVYNTSVEDVLITGLLSALKSVFGISKTRLCMESHGRVQIDRDIDIGRTVGWFTSLYPIVFDLYECQSIKDSIICVKEGLRKIPSNGIGWGICNYLIKANSCAGPNAQIVFNYLGQFNQRLNDQLFTISNEDTGEAIAKGNESTYPLEVTSLIGDEGLVVLLTYDKRVFRSATMDNLSFQYQIAMGDLAAHCRQQNKQILTPSDLAYSNLTVEEIDEIEKMFHEK